MVEILIRSLRGRTGSSVRGLSNLVVTLLLLSIAVPASVILVGKVREYADIARNQAFLNQPITIAAYAFRNGDRDVLVACNYGVRALRDVRVVDYSGNQIRVINVLEPRTCYLASLPASDWYSLITGGQVVSVSRVT